MNEKAEQLTEDRENFEVLRHQARSLIMATVGENALPRASYAPFVLDAGFFYIYLSRLSEHTLELIENPVVSVLLIEDETAASQIFARKRLTYLCESRTIERDDTGYDSILTLLTRRFGNVMDLLRSLPDFVLFRLTPRSGRFVSGFGRAYELAGERLEDIVRFGTQDPDPAVQKNSEQ